MIRFRLRRSGRVELVVREGCTVVGRKRVRAHPGLNQVPFDGRLKGRPLRPGRYTIAVVVTRGGTRRIVGKVAIRVVPPGHRVTKAQRTAPVAASSCPQTSSSFGPFFAAVSGAFAPNDAKASPRGPRPERATFKPPRLPVVFGEGDGGGGHNRLLLALWLVLGLAGAGLLVYGAVAIDAALSRNTRVRG